MVAVRLCLMNSLICARIASSSFDSVRVIPFRFASAPWRSWSVEAWLFPPLAGVGPGEICCGVGAGSAGIIFLGGLLCATSEAVLLVAARAESQPRQVWASPVELPSPEASAAALPRLAFYAHSLK